MNTEMVLTGFVIVVAAAMVVACIDAVITVYSIRSDRWLRRLQWYWNAAQWKVSDAVFSARVWLVNKKAGF